MPRPLEAEAHVSSCQQSGFPGLVTPSRGLANQAVQVLTCARKSSLEAQGDGPGPSCLWAPSLG